MQGMVKMTVFAVGWLLLFMVHPSLQFDEEGEGEGGRPGWILDFPKGGGGADNVKGGGGGAGGGCAPVPRKAQKLLPLYNLPLQ